MNEYMRTIRNAVALGNQVRGHKIFVGVKLFAIPHQVYYSGFDVFTWAKEHLIDVLVVGPRWETVDNDLPVEVWKKMMEPYGVQVGAALEFILRCHPHGEFYYLIRMKLRWVPVRKTCRPELILPIYLIICVPMLSIIPSS